MLCINQILSQFGVGRPAGGRPTIIGVGERRGVGRGENAGCGDVGVGRGALFEAVAGGVAGVLVGVAGACAGCVAVGAGAASTICPVSRMRATLSRVTSNSIFPFGGAAGAVSCLPFNEIPTLSAKPR